MILRSNLMFTAQSKKLRVYGIIIAINLFAQFPQPTYAEPDLDRQRQALNIIADFADRFCKNIPLEGTGGEIELSVQAKAELSGIVKKLASLGIEGAGKYQTSEYEGLLQKDITEALKSSVDCRLKIWQDLKSSLLLTMRSSSGTAHSDKKTFSTSQYSPEVQSPTFGTTGPYHVVTKSTKSLQDAETYSKTLRDRGYPSEVIVSITGFYAVTLGHYDKLQASSVVTEAIRLGDAPSDSYILPPERYLRTLTP